jgi:Asp-tRNA(Asn)/Glu-tRNA(Gln) amidotransferase A subunit family amidase
VVPARLNRDTTGPLARTVMDAARLFEAMVGHDPKDNLTSLLLQVMKASAFGVPHDPK